MATKKETALAPVTTMKVKDIMTSEPRTCAPDANLAEAAQAMWEADCGILPVTADGKLVGVVTDRDLFIALATKNARASQLVVGDIATGEVATCGPEDDIGAVLATMKQKRVLRVPVIGFGGAVLGIVSLNDIAIAAGPQKLIASDEVVATLQAICTHHHPVAHIVAA
jgi:CBS domain-containing protein